MIDHFRIEHHSYVFLNDDYYLEKGGEEKKDEKIGVQPGRTRKGEKRFRSYDRALNAIDKRVGKYHCYKYKDKFQ